MAFNQEEFFKNFDYDKLNKRIGESLNDTNLKYKLSVLNAMAKLSEIIINNTPVLPYGKSIHVSLNESINNAENFFKSLNPEYASRFRNIMNENGYHLKNGTNPEDKIFNDFEDQTVKFYRVLRVGEKPEYLGQHDYFASTVNDIDGSVRIDYNETLKDVFSIVHEITHKFSSQTQKSQSEISGAMIKDFLGETTSIAMEFLLGDYFIFQGKYDKSTIDAEKIGRFRDTLHSAGQVYFENALIELYKQTNGHITHETLLNRLYAMDRNSNLFKLFANTEKYTKSYMQKIVNSPEERKVKLGFPTAQRYVLGTLLGSYIDEEMKQDPSKKDILFELINILGNNNISINQDLRTLGDLGLPTITSAGIIVRDESIKKLEEAYKKQLISLGYKFDDISAKDNRSQQFEWESQEEKQVYYKKKLENQEHFLEHPIEQQNSLQVQEVKEKPRVLTMEPIKKDSNSGFISFISLIVILLFASGIVAFVTYYLISR